jgi:hypothetical protein
LGEPAASRFSCTFPSEILELGGNLNSAIFPSKNLISKKAFYQGIAILYNICSI